jgi:hypothetical protein
VALFGTRLDSQYKQLQEFDVPLTDLRDVLMFQALEDFLRTVLQLVCKFSVTSLVLSTNIIPRCLNIVLENVLVRRADRSRENYF